MNKIERISKVSDDIKYLKAEYEQVKMWGSCPDYDLTFESLMEWLSDEDNLYTMEYMIKVSKEIKSI